MSEPVRDAYDPTAIEPKWQRVWEEQKTFRAVRHPGRPKKYILDMFPYPSGAGLHVGHPEGYTATDIVCRFERMRGVDVLHPMGWDAFGLPAEQHAIRTGTHPRTTTLKNIDTFRAQLKSLGFSFDWEREVDTTDPGYLRWTQWIFLQLYRKGLAFQQSNMPVNWCPALGTVLANDEVTADGRSEVGGFPVEKLKIRQWSLQITAYADRLLEGLVGLDWPETKAKQTHWIGRSEGANVDFGVDGHPGATISVFTTRVDTLPGATYVVLAPEHPLAGAIATPEHRAAVERYAEEANRKSDVVRSDATRAKTGVPTGAFAVNPLNGEKLPIWVADYVIGGYGTGAVMAVPAHDERDHAFAVKYALPIVRVVAKPDGTEVAESELPYCDDAVANEAAIARMKGPKATKGMPSADVRRAVTDWLAGQGKGSSKVTYKLRDWVFSRQRYWGEPIPIYFPVTSDGDPRTPGAQFTIHYETPIPLEESELPLILPALEDYKPGSDPAGPLARALDWRFFQKDGKWFARETNTMPQWAGSCWYYLRFLDPKNGSAAWSTEAYDAWMPVDLYVGGSEHAVLHLLYARFWHKVLFDLGLVKHDEPFSKLVHQGLILGEVEHIVFQEAIAVPGSRARREGEAWLDAESGKKLVDRRMLSSELDERGTSFHLREADVPVLTTPEGEHFAFYVPGEALVSADRVRERDDGSWEDQQTRRTVVSRRVSEDEIVKKGPHFVLKSAPEVRVLSQAFKMSKSRGNVVNPDVLVKSHGADSLRLYEMFMGPLEAVKPWQTSGIEGVRRFLDRVWNAATNTTDDPAAYDVETQRLVHKTVKKVTEDIEGMRFNTAVSAMMILVNHLARMPKVPAAAARTLTLVVSPFAPHVGEELWQRLGGRASLAYEPWPAFDPALVKDDVVEIGVQVNGKARASIQIPAEADETTAKAIALEDARIKDFTAGKTLKKVIYVKGRILNLIVG
jgi:leucyl-tRNA synthetase